MKSTDYTIVPAKSEHAVQSVAFVCELGANISSEIIKKALDCYETTAGIKALFPRKQEGRGFSVALGPKGIGVKSGKDADAVTFDRVAPDGKIELALNFENNLISFTNNRYSRWKVVSTEAVGVLTEFTKFIFPNPGISTIGLQYVDEFFISGDLASFRPHMLFSETGGFLPPQMLTIEGPWHNHSGWFDRDEVPGKILNNLNIQTVQQRSKYVVQITSAHRCILSRPITSQDVGQSLIPARFEELHTRHKAQLKKLLNDDAKRMIHLDAE